MSNERPLLASRPGLGAHRSLFDVEDELTVPKVRDMTVAPVAAEDVREFARRYHYTGLAGHTFYKWGLWHGLVLFGVVAYDMPTRPAVLTAVGAEHGPHLWHMGRLALAEHAPHNSESRLIGGSLRAIEKSYPHVWWVETFAATDAGHVGYVYQATNALYTGLGGGKHYWLDEDGNVRASRTGDTGIARARGWERVPAGGKHRYVYVLGNARQRRERQALLRVPVLPYPKGDVPRGTAS